MITFSPLSHPGYRALLVTLLFAACFALGGCGEDEPKQRATFIELLEKNIMAKPGIRYTELTDAQKKEIGSTYVGQYELLATLHKDKTFDSKFSSMFSNMQKGLRPGPTGDMLPIVKSTRASMSEAEAFTESKLEELQTQKNALKQPDDLKVVYDKAFAKMVLAPLAAVVEVFQLATEALDASAALHEYLEQNPGAGEFSGNVLSPKKPEHEKKLRELLTEMNEKAQKVQEASKKLNSLIR